MAERAAKRALFDGLASVAKAMASGRRAEIVELLAQGARSVEDVAGELGESVANTSHHLRVLARAGLLRRERDGTRVIYRISSPGVRELWRALRELASAQTAEVERLARDYLGDRTGLEPVSREELVRRIRRADVFVLDVRPAPEFAAGHIRGARSVPVGELTRRLNTIPRDKEVVAYCRGPYCVFADEAVRVLRKKGYRARRLEDGFPEWQDAGLPIAAGGKETT